MHCSSHDISSLLSVLTTDYWLLELHYFNDFLWFFDLLQKMPKYSFVQVANKYFRVFLFNSPESWALITQAASITHTQCMICLRRRVWNGKKQRTRCRKSLRRTDLSIGIAELPWPAFYDPDQSHRPRYWWSASRMWIITSLWWSTFLSKDH